MNNIILGFKNLTLGIVATVAAASSTLPIIKPQNIPSPKPSPVNIQDTVTRSGQYSYNGYTLKYIVNVPKRGGPITGNFEGVCTGPITGKFAGPEGGKVEGEARANCKIAIFNYNLKAVYSGKLYLKQGKLDVNWEGQIPYTDNKGSFTVYFEPVK